MSIKFETNAYFNAVTTKILNSEEAIFKHIANSGLEFNYVDVKAEEFNSKYSSEGWVQRKVIALPTAIWTGAIKTIYHLFQALIGFLKPSSPHSKYVQSQVLTIKRDFQESFGWLISLFNDRHGQYHIQESRFHRRCYDYLIGIEELSTLSLLNTNQVHGDTMLTDSQSSTQNKDIDKEINEIKSSSDMPDVKDIRFAQLSKFYFENSDKTNALKAIREIGGDTFTKETFIATIAQSYCNEGQLEMALNVINEVKHYYKAKDSVLTSIAEAYFKSDRQKALTTINQITQDERTKVNFIAKLAQSYYSDSNESKVLEMIKIIARIYLRSHLVVMNGINFVVELHRNSSKHELEELFYTKLAQTCYEYTKKHFKNNSQDDILQGIKEKATEESVINEFLELKSK